MKVSVKGRLSTDSVSALLNATLQGLGVAILPQWVAATDLAGGRLVPVLTGWDVTASSFDTAVYALYATRDLVPHKLSAFLTFLDRVFKPVPPWAELLRGTAVPAANAPV